MTDVVERCRELIVALTENAELAVRVARQLRHEYGGGAVYIARAQWRDERNAEILDRYRAGQPIAVLAKQYCLSRRTVTRIVSSVDILPLARDARKA